jgi:hypothetical protein
MSIPHLSRDTSDLFHRNCACDCWWRNGHPYIEVSQLDKSSVCVCIKVYITASFWKPEVWFPPRPGIFLIVTTFLPALALLNRLALGTGTLSTPVIRNVQARFSMLRCLVVWVLCSSSRIFFKRHVVLKFVLQSEHAYSVLTISLFLLFIVLIWRHHT